MMELSILAFLQWSSSTLFDTWQQNKMWESGVMYWLDFKTRCIIYKYMIFLNLFVREKMATVITTTLYISVSLRECILNEIHAVFSKYAFIKWWILLYGLGYFHNFMVGSGFINYRKNLFTSFTLEVVLSINCSFCYEINYYFSKDISSLLSVYIKCRSSLYIGKAS